MKAIVFTLDALFAMMIAAAGISIILYFVYSSPTPTVIQYSSSSALLNELASTQIASVSGVGLAQAIYNQSISYNQTWDQRVKDQYNSGGNPMGPSLETVAYTVNAPYQIMNGTIVADYGNVYFGSGNIIYAINASTGDVVWTANTPFNAVAAYSAWPTAPRPNTYNSLAVNATVLYNGEIIYATLSNIVALNAYTGATIWSTNVQYAQGGPLGNCPGMSDYHLGDPIQVAEPDFDEQSLSLLLVEGKIITGVYDFISGLSSDQSGVPIYAIYASNGTYISGSSIPEFSSCNNPQYEAQHVVVAEDQIAVGTPAAGSDELYLISNIYNSTTNAITVWSRSPASMVVGGLATYANTIGSTEKDNANIYEVAHGGVAASHSMQGSGCSPSGVTSYNGRYVFQNLCGDTALNFIYETKWTSTSAPQTNPELAGLNNDTPVQTLNNVYTTWNLPSPSLSGGLAYILIQNISTGIYTRGVEIPYGGNENPNLVLAYGKLFTSVGNHLVAFGTCQAGANASMLSAIGTMYINNDGSCAAFLLNSLENSQNTTFTVNNRSIQTTSYFNGQSLSNAIISYSPGLLINGPFTVSLWVNSNVPIGTAFDSELIDTISSTDPNTFDLQLKNTGFSGSIGTGSSSLANPSYSFTVVPNTWYNVVLKFTKGTGGALGGWSMFINGANVSSGTYSTGIAPSFLGPAGIATGQASNIDLGGLPGPSSSGVPFNGFMANMQIYNTSLSTSQIGQIYSDGLTGAPVSGNSIVSWFPLAGDANGYGNQDFPGFDTGVSFVDANYNSTGFENSFDVSAQSIPALLFNYTTGTYGIYDLGIYSWK